MTLDPMQNQFSIEIERHGCLQGAHVKFYEPRLLGCECKTGKEPSWTFLKNPNKFRVRINRVNSPSVLQLLFVLKHRYFLEGAGTPLSPLTHDHMSLSCGFLKNP